MKIERLISELRCPCKHDCKCILIVFYPQQQNSQLAKSSHSAYVNILKDFDTFCRSKFLAMTWISSHSEWRRTGMQALKWHSFQERGDFPRIWFRDLWFRNWGLKINHLHVNAHNFVWQGCFFLSFLSHNFDDWLSSNFHRFCCNMYMLRHTKWEDWSLTLTNSVHSL